MNFVRLYFSYSGRIGRSVYLGGFIANVLAVLTLGIIVETVILGAKVASGANLIRGISFPVIVLISLTSLVALHVKRLHDLDRDLRLVLPTFITFGICGWWIHWSLSNIPKTVVFWLELPLLGMSEIKVPLSLLFVLPAIGIFAFIVFLYANRRGQHGPNRYGFDPRDEENYPEGRADFASAASSFSKDADR